MAVYGYEVASNVKMNNNYGRLCFPDDNSGMLAINKLNTILAPGAKCQFSKKLISYEKKSLPVVMKDWLTGRFTLYSTAHPEIQKTFRFPGVEPVLDAGGKVDAKATLDKIYEVAQEFITRGVMDDQNLYTLDALLIPGVGKVRDVTVQDSLSITSTP